MRQLLKEQHGQGLVEYTLMVIVVALIFWVVIKNTDMGNRLASNWSKVSTCIGDPAACNSAS